ncbi:MAG: ligase-associated DNA damage response DEXH box helicase [Rhodospirillales bacterium]|nr:ligase-associated DNA damage response DEXH box helicase [Rhodospirillales bacterium]
MGARLTADHALLPATFARWFRARGWAPHAHQTAMLEAAAAGRSTLLMAPTGGGKTLAGFLPSLVELAGQSFTGLHTLYVSPLKALTVDIARNLERPIAELGLPIACETRTGDTPQSKRLRQRRRPPHMLLTTPESLALLLSYPDGERMFGGLRRVVVDELHALAGTKRGDQLALCLARLARLAPDSRRIGLSATVAWPEHMRRFLGEDTVLIEGEPGVRPRIDILVAGGEVPWAGHSARHAMPDVYEAIRRNRTTIVFVNTRSQAEIVFQELWRLNDAVLPIALHHGSLAVEQRRKVEAAMARGDLRAVVATSSLDLGVDWAAVDLVVQIGAPKGSTRLIQRVGRANHRLNEPSRALQVPGNRFEYIECRAALEAVTEGALDGDPPRPGALDVLAQHILGTACAGPFRADDLFAEVRSANPYADLSRQDFDDTLAFVADGGYALRSYDRFRRLRRDTEGDWRVAGQQAVRQFRMNVGTIVEAPMLRVQIRRGKVLGEVEESFIQALSPGDTFAFAGQILRFEGLRETTAEVSRAAGADPKVPAYLGGRFALTSHIAERVRSILADPRRWAVLPDDVRAWLALQARRSVLPSADGMLVETFARGRRHFLVAYGFAGRNAHQTLGMLLTRRMQRAGCAPLGFVASDYAIAVWSLRPVGAVDALFDQDMLTDDLEEWLAESSMLRRTFRNVAVIAGLVERRHPGQEKTGRQVTFSADLIYDVLRRHEPGHVLLRATRAEAEHGLTDVARLADLLARVQGRIEHRPLPRVSPLAVPVLLDIGQESVAGASVDDLLAHAAEELVAEALAE